MLEYLEFLTKMLDERKAVDVLYLDFIKSFDKVPHKRLLEKCRGLGVEGKVLAWIGEWLWGRKQRAVLDGQAYVWAEVHSKVPEGSVLGPILFLIFINDIDKAVNNLLKFTDDTKLGAVMET